MRRFILSVAMAVVMVGSAAAQDFGSFPSISPEVRPIGAWETFEKKPDGDTLRGLLTVDADGTYKMVITGNAGTLLDIAGNYQFTDGYLVLQGLPNGREHRMKVTLDGADAFNATDDLGATGRFVRYKGM